MILVVDDSEIARTELCRIVKTAGYDSIEASNGLQGVKTFKEKSSEIELIITDLNMPEMDGLGMCEAIRGLDIPNLPPILISTTETAQPLRDRAKKLGVSGWVFKPVVAKNLLPTLKILIERFNKS